MYHPLGDTLFNATMFWMGHGEISYPEIFHPPDSFPTLETSVSQPSHIERFQYYSSLEEEVLIARTDCAWLSVDNLELVHLFIEQHCKIGYYLYTPVVLGGFSPHCASWIIFLYLGNR